jgi:hypothetical protein
MHALMISVTFADRQAALGAELDQFVETTSTQPGFVAGYWTAMRDDTGETVIVFAAAEDAEAFATRIGEMPPMSMMINSIRIGEVVESLHSYAHP